MCRSVSPILNDRVVLLACGSTWMTVALQDGLPEVLAVGDRVLFAGIRPLIQKNTSADS